jgi:hypothetical protein
MAWDKIPQSEKDKAYMIREELDKKENNQ